jgi:histone H3/H4
MAARRAVAAAKSFEDTTRPIEANPFARVLVEAGLARALRAERAGSRPAAEVLLELIERAFEQASESGRGTIESRPSGLILPR